MYNWLKLLYGGSEMGDELILAAGCWKRGASLTTSAAGLEPIARLDDRPLAVSIYPRFRVLKKTSDSWLFEQWIFDLLGWADGGRRELIVVTQYYEPVASYGYCKLIGVDRPEPQAPNAARWSDQVVLTFLSDTQPQYYNWST